jgi:hypothetical protein
MSYVRFSLRIALIATVSVGLAASTRAGSHSAVGAPVNQSAAPDSYGYKWIDNQGQDDPAAGGSGPNFSALWTDISASGAALSAIACDDCTTTFTCPILIRYYGQNWGTAPQGSNAQVVSPTIVVSSNSNLQFLTSGQGPNASYTNSSLPAGQMNGMVAIMWDDTYGASGGNTARWEVVGSAPNRRLIVQYTSWDWCCSDGANMEYQIQLTESDGTSESAITFLYNDIGSDSRELGDSATIGIQSPNASSYLQYSYNQASLADNRAIRFYTNENPFDPTNLVQAADAGGPAKQNGYVSDATAYFRGGVTDPDAGNTIGIQVEILPSTVPFTANISGQTTVTAAADMVASGGTAEAVYVFDGTPYGSGDYHWRARSIDNGGGVSNWVLYDVASINFRVDLDPPTPTFPPYSPAMGQTMGVVPPAGNVAFRWGPAADIGPAGPISYRVQVSTTVTFASTLADDLATTTTHIVFLAIKGDPYYWRVAAVDQAGNQGPWSTAISFFVDFDDGANHGGGDCTQGAAGSPGSAVGLLIAMLIAAAAFRRM